MQEFVDLVVVPARAGMRYGEALLKDVKPEQFGRMPNGVRMSPPAFVYGHLAIYPSRLFTMWGISGHSPIDERTAQRYAELFGPGIDAPDDADGSVYPPMDEIVSCWQRGYGAALEAARDVPASVFAATNPNERMRERFPTIGSASAFLLGGHQLLHLGQVSAWRRMVGLGPAM